MIGFIRTLKNLFSYILFLQKDFFCNYRRLLSAFQQKKILITVALLLFYVLGFFPLFTEDYYQFSKAYLPASTDFEKRRNICFFPFRNVSNDNNLEYLSKGIPGVIASSFRNIKYVYDPNPIPLKIQHEMGKKSSTEVNSKTEYSLETDPRYIKIDLDIINSVKPILKEQAISEGKNKGCFYIISGDYKVLNSEILNISLEITESKNGSTKIFNYKTSIKRSFQELGDAIAEIKTDYFLKGSSSMTLEIVENDVFVYLDGELYGKTPITKNPILPGKHKILFLKEGFQRVERIIEVFHETENKFQFEIRKIESIAKLNIQSIPSDSDIYIGNKFIGKTPLENIDVPKGQNRVKASKEGYIDKFSSIDIKDNKTYSLNLNLKEGDSDLFYKYNNQLFLDYTYSDFGNFSVFSSLIFYGIYTYSGYKESSEKDKLNGRSIFNTVSLFQGLQLASSSEENLNLFLTSAFYQQGIVNQVQDSTAIYRQGQQIGIGGVVTMLALSGYFFYTGFNSESFEIGLKPSLNPTQSSEATFQYNFKF